MVKQIVLNRRVVQGDLLEKLARALDRIEELETLLVRERFFRKEAHKSGRKRPFQRDYRRDQKAGLIRAKKVQAAYRAQEESLRRIWELQNQIAPLLQA